MLVQATQTSEEKVAMNEKHYQAIMQAYSEGLLWPSNRKTRSKFLFLKEDE